MSAPVDVGPLQAHEIEAAVHIFFDGFAHNAQQLYGDPPNPAAMVDVWSFARSVEPGAFLAARDGATLIGYALFTSSVSTLQRKAVLSGKIFVWALRALAGRYGLRWSRIFTQLWNKMLFVGSSSSYRSEGDAQLLNIAVAKSARGRGAATALVMAGLRYLASRGVREVRLEVQPDNAAAIAAYRHAGFVERGRVRNVYGEWIVMTARPAPP